MNRIWTQVMLDAVRYAMKQCPQCRKAAAYPQFREETRCSKPATRCWFLPTRLVSRSFGV